jgi:hypothetical protein
VRFEATTATESASRPFRLRRLLAVEGGGYSLRWIRGGGEQLGYRPAAVGRERNGGSSCAPTSSAWYTPRSARARRVGTDWLGGEEEGSRGGRRRLQKRRAKGIGAWDEERKKWRWVLRGAGGCRDFGSYRDFRDMRLTYGEVAAANFRLPEDSSAYLIATRTQIGP